MAQTMTFLHAADLHLGAPFRGLRALSPEWADRLCEAIPEAFERMVDTALSRNVEFVVIAGDVFDEARASYGDYVRFFKGIERLSDAGVFTYICTGNHDPYAQWQQDFFDLPPRALLFDASHPSFALHERDGEPLCVLGGRGYPNKVWDSEQDIAEGLTRAAAERELGARAAAAPFGVGVLHTGLNLDTVKAPTNPEGLLRAGFNYWALGHIHMPYVDDEANPRLVFSGCIQGRDIKETGPRGVNVVTLEQGAPNKIEFVPTASVVWQRLEVNIEDCSSVTEVIGKIMSEQFAACARAHCERMISRITLVGKTSLHDVLARPRVLDDMRIELCEARDDFFVDALIDKTTRPLDRAKLRAERTFASAVLDVSANMAAQAPAQISFLQEEFLKRGVSMPALSADEVAHLMGEAENEVLDLLICEGEQS